MKKIYLAALLLAAVFILSGCGAAVHTNTVFHEDGSGERVIVAKVYYEDEQYIDGGFAALDVLVRQNAPTFMNVEKREGESDQYFTYELSYDFEGIDEYKQKTKEITGEKPDIKWKEKKGMFQKKVTYQETISTQQLMGWAANALMDSNYADVLQQQWYYLETNTVYYEDECVWSGTSDPEFKIDATPKVENVSVYTKYAADGDMYKKICLSLDPEDFMKMDLEQSLAYLKVTYSDLFEVDTASSRFVLAMKNKEQLDAFFQHASEPLTKEECQKAGQSWDTAAGLNSLFEDNRHSSTLSDVFEVREAYNLRTFLNEFRLTENRVHYYIKVPSGYEYETKAFTKKYQAADRKKYSYAAVLPAEQMFCMEFQFHDTIKVKKHQVSYQITPKNTAIQTVTLLLDANGKKIGIEELKRYYSEFDAECTIRTSEEGFFVTLVKEIPLDTESADENWVFSWKLDSNASRGLDYYFLFLQYDPKYYLPIGEEDVPYEVEVPAGLKIRSMSWNGKAYEAKDIRSLKDNGSYHISGTLQDGEILQINLMLSQMKGSSFVLLILICIMTVVVIGSAVIYFYLIKHGVIKVTNRRG